MVSIQAGLCAVCFAVRGSDGWRGAVGSTGGEVKEGKAVMLPPESWTLQDFQSHAITLA